MQHCKTIYYLLVSWLLNMFRAILFLETCRAAKEQGDNELSYTVASCWSFCKNCIMMHENIIIFA